MGVETLINPIEVVRPIVNWADIAPTVLLSISPQLNVEINASTLPKSVVE